MSQEAETQAELILAAEDCAPELFDELHRFSTLNDRRIITTLIAHGPVLLRGGRGTGKSAFMIAASRQLDPLTPTSTAVGIYMSLRHAPLLKSTGDAYERILAQIIIRQVQDTLGGRAGDFDPSPDVGSVQHALSKLASKLGKRIVLFFDDAAHLGREASLEEFFDIYRTLSSSAVSCKAAIYPGVTRFGVRFDVYNDATVIDLLRSEEFPGFGDTFLEVMAARYPDAFGENVFRASLSKQAVATFLAQSTLGNMRGFVFACNALKVVCADGRNVGLPELGESLIQLARNYYWPLLDEIQPKLGKYEPMVSVARQIAELVFEECGQKPRNPRDMLVYREIDERLAKPLQILEYAGFISKREASRAMKSGGRGARYALNLCALLEQTPGARLTKELFDRWTTAPREEAVQFNKASKLASIPLPALPESADLAIFNEPIEKLGKSPAYPYGLTRQKIQVLTEAGIHTVGDLAEVDDETLDALPKIGDAMVQRIRNVLGQAIWM
ncbi:helix-hairpin-helix domain-containing protein [Corallococcus llansteffanensis]|uniref:helix-hairpin-helix domain-containing protein n=1 Tax=Corallococcus llansteffanensis TaxID=2316731 RepID=UPI0011C46EFB|nr:helix-hairpin-helix domain-containing protein [Corallococcus llansteffanensis]